MNDRVEHVRVALRQSGFTIVEIMVAMVVSLVLLGGVLQIYISSKQTYTMAENVSRMQENARFAMNILTKEIRMAGFMPCRKTGNFVNTLNGGGPSNFATGAIVGYEGGVSTFPGEFPATGTSAGDRVADTDALWVMRGGNESYTVVSHNPSSANFKLNDLHTLEDFDLLLICDATNAALFQTTNVNSANVTVVHNTGVGTPGNCTKSLGGNGDCSDTTNIEQHTYGDDSQVVKFESKGYFVGVSASGNSRSLYRVRLANVSGSIQAVTEELLEGIETMQLLYGVDTDDDGEPEQYITANNVTGGIEWNDVVSARVSLMVHTPEEVATEDDIKTYNVAGTLIDDSSTAITHLGDKRLRYVFTSTIKLRNRGAM